MAKCHEFKYDYYTLWLDLYYKKLFFTDSRKPLKLRFPFFAAFKICKGSCKPKFMLTQRFQVTEAGREIRTLQWSEFSTNQTLTLHERQLCSWRTQERKKRAVFGQLPTRKSWFRNKWGKYLRFKHSAKWLEISYSADIYYRISSYVSIDLTSL